MHGSDSKENFRPRKGEENTPDSIVSTVKFPACQIVWTCMSLRGAGCIHFIKGNLNAKDNINILRANLLPTIPAHFNQPRN